MPKPASKVTIYTIAQDVGVSAAAVSIVLSNRQTRKRISEETAEKIRQSAQRLGYVPNIVGRRLRTQSSVRQIDLAIATSFEAPLALVGEWVHYLHTTLQPKTQQGMRFGVAIELFNAGKLSEIAPLLYSNRYNGILITNTSPEDDRFLDASTPFPIPMVIIGRQLKNHCCVTEPLNAVGHAAAEMLHRSGARKPAILLSDKLSELTHNRLQAFNKRALDLWGAMPLQVRCESVASAAGAAALKPLLASARSRPDALFAVTDSLLLGAYRALHEFALKIPDDISVVGIGDYETSSFYDPCLTTLADTHTAMRQAVPLLLDMILGHRVPESHTTLLSPSAVLRGSVKNEKNFPAVKKTLTK